jgi:hypothetical protein
MASKKTETKLTEEGKQHPDQVDPTLYIPLDEEFNEILKPDSNNSVFVACTIVLKRFNLHNRYDAAFVLNEAYMRTRKALEAGQTISNYPAWLKSANFNIVRELSRAEKKNRESSVSTEVDSVTACEADTWIDDDIESVEQQRMRKAFATLSPLEQAILQLKVVKGLRWGEVQTALSTAGFESFSLNLLSQKKGRALQKLKATFLSTRV